MDFFLLFNHVTFLNNAYIIIYEIIFHPSFINFENFPTLVLTDILLRLDVLK